MHSGLGGNYIEITINNGHDKLLATVPGQEGETNLALTVYADDLKRKHVVDPETDSNNKAKEIQRITNNSNSLLSECIATSGYGQNLSKQVNIPRVAGAEMISQTHALLSGKVHLDGQVQLKARYLGPIIHY